MAFYNAPIPTNVTAYPQYGPQNYYTPTQPQSAPYNTFVWVQGEAGARAYPVAPGNKIALFDSENPVVYIKSTDSNGRPLEMEIYDLVKRERPVSESVIDAHQIDMSKYITREELKDLMSSVVSEEVERAMSEISLRPTASRRKKEVDE